LKQPEILRFVALLEGLSILQDGQAVSESVSTVLPLARADYDVCDRAERLRRGNPA
jgi:hypothetical protein